MILLRKFFVKSSDLELKGTEEEDHTYVGQYVVVNPAIIGKTIAEVSQGSHIKFIISRIWRDEEVILPQGATVLENHDNLLVIANKDDVTSIEILFGQTVRRDWNKEQIDWNKIDSNVESRTIVLTKNNLNGKLLGQLRLRDMYNVNVSRVVRGDIKLLATEDLRLRYGDHLTL